MFATSPRRASVGGVRWLEPGRVRRRRVRLAPFLLVLLVCGLAAVIVVVVQARLSAGDARRDAARGFAAAWARGDLAGMWARLDARAQSAWPEGRFAASYRAAARAATVTAVRVGRAGPTRGGHVALPAAVRTRRFGTLRGTLAVPVDTVRGRAGVAWAPYLRLPGLRPGETVRRRDLARPRRAAVLGADGLPLDRTPAAAAIAKGLATRYAARLNGRAGAELIFGRRVVARAPRRPAHAVHATIRPGLQTAARAALGNALGGVAAVRPATGDVLALAGLAVSAPQPPGSTFKIITLSAALQAGIATPASSYPVRTFALLSGVKLRNANDEACGGSLPTAFAQSCNSVFAPLGARLGARRLVRMAEAFGFNERPNVPAAQPSVIPQPRDLKDALAVGASAIGQDRDAATPLEMATVAATIGARGVRARPRVVRSDPVRRRRAVGARVAAQVRAMMLGVVRSGTGTAAALPGIEVAGKTGTAELRPTVGGPPNPRNTDAWFVAFAPAHAPRIAVAVMVVGAGAGGRAAAPIARRVLQAALG